MSIGWMVLSLFDLFVLVLSGFAWVSFVQRASYRHHHHQPLSLLLLLHWTPSPVSLPIRHDVKSAWLLLFQSTDARRLSLRCGASPSSRASLLLHLTCRSLLYTRSCSLKTPRGAHKYPSSSSSSASSAVLLLLRPCTFGSLTKPRHDFCLDRTTLHSLLGVGNFSPRTFFNFLIFFFFSASSQLHHSPIPNSAHPQVHADVTVTWCT